MSATSLRWLGVQPPKSCPKCGSTDIRVQSQEVSASADGSWSGRPKVIGRMVTQLECRPCSVAHVRERFVEDIERGGTDHEAAVAFVEQHFDERSGGLVMRRD